MKKRKGNIVDVMSSLIVILCAVILMYTFLSVVGIANYKSDVKTLARAYLLEMETVGYLTASSAASLRQELTDMGVTDIDLSGTTLSSVGYGQPIYLNINCNIPVEVLNSSSGDLMSFFFEESAIPCSIPLKSTAKH